MMEKIEAAKTSDGLLFECEAEGELHQLWLDFRVWYEEHKCYSRYVDGCRMESSDMENWLMENSEYLMQLFIKEKSCHDRI